MFVVLVNLQANWSHVHLFAFLVRFFSPKVFLIAVLKSVRHARSVPCVGVHERRGGSLWSDRSCARTCREGGSSGGGAEQRCETRLTLLKNIQHVNTSYCDAKYTYLYYFNKSWMCTCAMVKSKVSPTAVHSYFLEVFIFLIKYLMMYLCLVISLIMQEHYEWVIHIL